MTVTAVGSCSAHALSVVQEVDRVVARVRARENEQHDALSPVQAFVNAHMQVLLSVTPPASPSCSSTIVARKLYVISIHSGSIQPASSWPHVYG